MIHIDCATCGGLIQGSYGGYVRVCNCQWQKPQVTINQTPMEKEEKTQEDFEADAERADDVRQRPECRRAFKVSTKGRGWELIWLEIQW